MTLLRYDAAREDAPLRAELEEAMRGVVERGVYLHGPETSAFEREFLMKLGEPSVFGVAVASGTAALVLALRALGIGPGDEVITVSNAGPPGPTAIRSVGAEVVFCDVDPETLLMDPASAAVVAGPRTRALLPVHLFGNMVDITALRAAVPGVPVLEDCAQAFGSQLRGQLAGTLADAAAFSFYPTKNLGALGDAGFVAGPPALVLRARELANYGRGVHGLAQESGMMSRTDELQAAVLRVKLRHFADAVRRKSSLCAAYDGQLPRPLSRVGHRVGEAVVNLYVVRVSERSNVQAALEAKGIAAGVHYPVAAHQMPAFADARRASLPVSERACDEVLSLPFFPSMPIDAVSRVCAALEAAM